MERECENSWTLSYTRRAGCKAHAPLYICVLVIRAWVTSDDLRVWQVWPLTQDLNGLFLAGSFLLPYSWALHVACWIQRNNGK